MLLIENMLSNFEVEDMTEFTDNKKNKNFNNNNNNNNDNNSNKIMLVEVKPGLSEPVASSYSDQVQHNLLVTGCRTCLLLYYPSTALLMSVQDPVSC